MFPEISSFDSFTFYCRRIVCLLPPPNSILIPAGKILFNWARISLTISKSNGSSCVSNWRRFTVNLLSEFMVVLSAIYFMIWVWRKRSCLRSGGASGDVKVFKGSLQIIEESVLEVSSSGSFKITQEISTLLARTFHYKLQHWNAGHFSNSRDQPSKTVDWQLRSSINRRTWNLSTDSDPWTQNFTNQRPNGKLIIRGNERVSLEK